MRCLMHVAMGLLVAICMSLPAWAQGVVLDPADYHICNALSSDRGKDVCKEYYKRKEAIMNEVLDTYYQSLFRDPGNEGVKREVLLKILEWQDHLDELYEALSAELPAGDWPEELHAAFHDEVTSTDTAAAFWSNECEVATMVNQGILVLEDAEQDYIEKVLELHNIASQMAEDYQDAQRALAAGLSPEQRSRLCVEFAPNVAKAVTISYAMDQIYDQLIDTFIDASEDRDRYQAVIDEDTARYFAPLGDDWELDEQAGDHMLEALDNHWELALGIKDYSSEYDTIFDNLGEPFDRIDSMDITDEFKRALDAICQ